MTLVIDRENDTHTTSTLGGRVADAVRRHDAGDPAAMTDLVRCVTPWLFHVCRDYRLSLHTAQDVVQTTLLTLVEHVHTVRDPNGALSWLTVVARREAMRVANKERRVEPVGDLAAFDRPLPSDDPESAVQARLRRAVVLRNLAKLPDRTRRLLFLMFLAEVKGYAVLGDLLDMPVGSIGPTRQRGLDALRRLLLADAEWADPEWADSQRPGGTCRGRTA